MEYLTEHNHNIMKTEVETFVIEENAELIYDGEALDTWKELISDLGLTGQNQIVRTEKSSPIPFLHLKKGMVETLKTLLPREYKVEDFNVTPIPLEILKLVALAKKEEYFEKIIVLYDDKNPDPAVLGTNHYWYSTNEGRWKNKHSSKASAQAEMDEKGWTGKPESTYDREYYLIGKWGDVKQSFEELKEKAKKRFIEEQGADLRKKLKETQRELDDLEITAVEKFN